MSVMDKFLTAMKLNGEDDEYFEDGYYGEEEEEEPVAPVRQRESARGEIKNPVQQEDRQPRQKPQLRPVPPANRQNKGGGKMAMHQGMEICAIKPTSMEDTREVTDTLLKNRSVILNLEGIDVDVAQRIVDFVSGSCYAMKGNLQKISRYIFIITPASVEISGDLQEMIGGSTFGAASSSDN
ncbi:MAG: cell division protein SepF [Lachnospiraceae bacterium]|nr:cell division protein SepF [Lachnospiraceae bacterium]